MKRRIAVVAGLAVVAVVALILSFTAGRDGKAATRSAQKTKGVSPTETVVTEKRQDPRTLKRGSVAGTITDKQKQPIAGARVCADGWSHDAPADAFRDATCVTSDDKGAYRIENLLAATYSVSAIAKTYRPGFYERAKNKQSLRLAAGEAKTGIDIALEAGGVEIIGTVSDITGGPVANATVRASAGRWGGTHGPPAETDAKGQYSMWVKPGPIRVTASADGYAEASEMGQAPGTFDLLLTPESSLSGTVVDASTGQPIEGARVTVQASGFGWKQENDRSDAQGKFRVSRLTPGRYVAEAKTERGYGRSEGSSLVGLGQHVEGVVVRVHPALRIQGKVMIKSDKPTVCEDGYAWFRDEANNRWASGRTDPDGTITADGVVPGKYSVSAGCRGYASVKEKFDPIEVKDKDVLGVVWEVETGSTIKGKITNKRGEPIADADISARSTGGNLRSETQWSSETSKADGSYELDGLRAATYLLEIDSKKGVAPREGIKVDAPPGKTVEKDIVLDDGGRIEGVVVDEQGKPVANVKVQANNLEEVGWFRWGDDIKTDAAGKFTIEGMRAGEYRVMAMRGWWQTMRKPGESDDEHENKRGEKVSVKVAETTKVKLVVESQSGTIKGVVVDSEGKPVPDAYLSSARESDAAGAQQSNVQGTREWDWGDEKPTLTNVDGTFAIGNLSPGKYTIRAYRKGGGEAVVEHVAVGTTTRLQIKNTGSIAGVAKRASGPPPDDITISVVDMKTGFSRDETFYKTQGRFTVDDLPKGHFHITATTDGGSKKIEIDLAEGEKKTGIELEFERLVTVTGRVVEYGTQKPVPGMQVFAQAATAGSFVFGMGGDDDNANISDETGRFTVKRVPQGKISIHGMAKEWKSADYTWFRALKTIDGSSSTVDIGDVGVIKRRVKEGDKAGEMGVNFAEMPPDTEPDKYELKVSWIDPQGPAAKSGLKVGDIVTSVDGVDVSGGNAMHAYTLMNAPPGTKLTLGLSRNATVSIVLVAP